MWLRPPAPPMTFDVDGLPGAEAEVVHLVGVRDARIHRPAEATEAEVVALLAARRTDDVDLERVAGVGADERRGGIAVRGAERRGGVRAPTRRAVVDLRPPLHRRRIRHLVRADPRVVVLELQGDVAVLGAVRQMHHDLVADVLGGAGGRILERRALRRHDDRAVEPGLLAALGVAEVGDRRRADLGVVDLVAVLARRTRCDRVLRVEADVDADDAVVRSSSLTWNDTLVDGRWFFTVTSTQSPSATCSASGSGFRVPAITAAASAVGTHAGRAAHRPQPAPRRR